MPRNGWRKGHRLFPLTPFSACVLPEMSSPTRVRVGAASDLADAGRCSPALCALSMLGVNWVAVPGLIERSLS